MTHQVRARMYVSAINLAGHSADAASAGKHSSITHFNAAYSPDPTNENYSYSQATPSANLKIRKDGPSDFSIGQTYSLTFEEVAESCEGAYVCKKADTGDWGATSSLYVELRNEKSYTEFAECAMVVSNKSAWSFFRVGAHYAITFAPV